MAFLVLGILGMIAISPDNEIIELKEDLQNIEMPAEPKPSEKISLGGQPLDAKPVKIEESLEVEITKETPEPEVMEEKTMEKMDESKIHVHNVVIPEGVGVPGCEETNECYVPYSLSMKVGHKVIWTNEDTAAHTVTSGTVDGGPDGIFDSSIFMSGATFEHTFNDPGKYDYFCIVHPWMIGIIEVV
ncbi:MAG: plastocyanin/azurin family copper-binding protein [Nitrosopumilaceae archaeon]|nr:plastocyanin/azurin family copper-binding protein [Nitrosopumilaceae archaeon]